MGSISQPISPESPNRLPALSGSTPSHQGSARAANPSWPPSTSPFEPRDAAGTLRRTFPPSSSIAPNLTPPRQETTSGNFSLLHPEHDKTTNSGHEWLFARDSQELGPSCSSSNLQLSRMQTTRDSQHQLYNMLPNAVAGPSSSGPPFQAPPPEPYGGGNIDFQWMANPNVYPPPLFPGYNTNPMSGDPNSRADSETMAQVGAADYTNALNIFRHLQAALPHIRPASALGPPATGQNFSSLLDIAHTASDMLEGKTPKPAPVRQRTHPREPLEPRFQGGKRARVDTYCRGCGATETPEWRRGPLGPRTLCNACGLVHMKMQRKKKKKAEERAVQENAGQPPPL
ncbi:hypothetical protein CcaverHIS002_0507130 [Cutaneotrichosporon cavernicola]|uniref:GATA-type domain-containing protein n=1 Tax=Cutaneotrichosporon cavernicola TaxID=279322 RepID=A0AA48L742_9TREE|nr:uncharacterized protein CcaverHIS019_0507680 [Cutaneotrichosporon cavernicola]BEI85312.1 hypothetical protein CcaverHIS002_0507130 [Cutaneotrichosporon cavernicola]BEI93140.1 hypothetical protein CcaverHIS019_0507680 [Cutaneotrichosporon cavernicola]BEJ00916.1 hypothetical protein CcaverHIS631_0507730 [Cutaneotrichosporon cavernicola]BEJ08682.1 hypothetical protein CcaverHIS641_0507760 [Cutaneotrichosporon cavernicola]